MMNCNITIEEIYERMANFLIYKWNYIDWEEYATRYLLDAKNRRYAKIDLEKALNMFRAYYRASTPIDRNKGIGFVIDKFLDKIAPETLENLFGDSITEVIEYTPNVKDLLDYIFDYDIWDCEDEHGTYHFLLEEDYVKDIIESDITPEAWTEIEKEIAFQLIYELYRR